MADDAPVDPHGPVRDDEAHRTEARDEHAPGSVRAAGDGRAPDQVAPHPRAGTIDPAARDAEGPVAIGPTAIGPTAIAPTAIAPTAIGTTADGGTADDCIAGDGATRCTARTRLYQDGRLALSGFPVADISEYVGRPGTTVWLDLHDPDHDDLAVLSEEFGLHPLAVEDALHPHQRAKLDRYRSHLFLSAYGLQVDPDTYAAVTGELAVLITPSALITVRKDHGLDLDAVVDRWDANPDLAGQGVGYLLYGLLDVIVDGHFDAVRTLDDAIEDLEDALFADDTATDGVQRRSFELRKTLVRTRRVVLPMREVVNGLMRRDLHVVDETMMPYFQDVYDHVLRATEWTESLRDMVTTILETHLTIQGNQLNEIMKKLTSWAAIIAVPTAITGFFGQNVPFPGSGQPWGFAISLAAIIVMGAVLYVSLKRRHWL
ncbi:Magnesium transporter (modular protein) [Frankia canadensis]|uniref:Magnesium transporter (Modular protein) n=1 Tax=Frankia canadensis TaxID=1836972 RepID=A0A2I2KZU5_9ACTN|nr:CorA family divalent cation transporter [Frankia canadensis]SNQ51175.1 Magnesium transporter (modular protein) [Frankia canadensis]SOU58465.1 Magnesium transporter (modular protein) [Frankia canadensis]